MGFFAGIEKEFELVANLVAALIESHPAETAAVVRAIGTHVAKGYPASAPVVAAVETAVAP